MISIDNKFELSIPTHIAFALHKHDYIDNLIIARVRRECKNESSSNIEFVVSLEQFESAIRTSSFLRAELQKTIEQDLLPNPNFKPNSIFFLQTILSRLSNLERITFKISDDKLFSRLIKSESGIELVSFNFNIIEGVFDLTKILNRRQLDTFNKHFINVNIISNKYLNRTSYFYIKAVPLFDILASMDEFDNSHVFDKIASLDPKIEEDNPILLLKTDYTLY